MHAWDESECAFCACSKTHFCLARPICLMALSTVYQLYRANGDRLKRMEEIRTDPIFCEQSRLKCF